MSAIKSINGINRLQIKSFNGILKSSVSNKNGITNQRPRSLPFDGINDYISIQNSASLQVTGAQSWSIWCKLEDVTANQSLFGIRESSTTKYKIYCFKRASNDATVAYRNQIQVTISADGGFINQKSYISVGLTSTSWGLLTTTFTAGTLKLYWNAVELTTGAGTLTKITDGTVNSLYNNTTEPLLIGALNATPSFFAKGYLDYLIFCNKTLSSTEVSEIYSAKPNLLPVASGFSFSANIVSLWKIGEDPDVYNGTGGILDSVGTNHGTMNNFSVGGSFSTDVAT